MQLATDAAERPNQASSEQQQGGWLRRRARAGGGAAGAQDVESSQALRAIGIPAISAIGGIEIQSRDVLAVKVPRQPAGVVNVHGAENHEVLLTCGQGHVRIIDGDQSAAVTEGGAAAEISPHTQLATRKTVIVAENRRVERIHAGNVADAQVNRRSGTGQQGGEQVRSCKARSHGAGAGNGPARAALVHVTLRSQIGKECLLCHRRQASQAESECH